MAPMKGVQVRIAAGWHNRRGCEWLRPSSTVTIASPFFESHRVIRSVQKDSDVNPVGRIAEANKSL